MPIVTRERWEHTAWGVRWATVERIDAAADVAVLAPESAALAELDPLALAGRDPAVGEHVRMSSGRWWSEAGGDVLGLYYSDAGAEPAERWVAGATVAPGWSGSAVLDSAGHVIGVVTACQLDALAGARTCRPGWAVFEGVRQ
jgi:S1-C subfamily serine protease